MCPWTSSQCRLDKRGTWALETTKWRSLRWCKSPQLHGEFRSNIASEKGGFLYIFFPNTWCYGGGDETDAEKEAVGIFVVKECWLRTFFDRFRAPVCCSEVCRNELLQPDLFFSDSHSFFRHQDFLRSI